MNEPTWLKAVRTHQVTGEDWASYLTLAIVLGFIIVGYYGWKSGTAANLVAALLLGGACLVIGVLLGFLFGIPRALQSNAPPPELDRSDPKLKQEALALRIQYAPNTNLEQISDWLTKILVGVGLTQLVAMPDLLKTFGGYFGTAIGKTEVAPQQIAVTILIFFSVAGFLFGYLWTRLFLGGQLAKADRNITEQVQGIVEEQAQLDAKALYLVTQYLSETDVGTISVEELRRAVEKASPTVKVQIFYQARDLRSRSWQKTDEKWNLERTIPIFESLIASDKENRFHRYHAQLGYALKDKQEPDYARAEVQLTAAIGIRGPASEGGRKIYEFNRAICRIKQDPNFLGGKKSSAEARQRIISDLNVAVDAIPNISEEPDINRWSQLNEAADLLNQANRSHSGQPPSPRAPGT